MKHETNWTPATFTDDEYEALLASSALDRLGRFELRRGALTRMNAQLAPHLRVKMQVLRAVIRAVEEGGVPLEYGTEASIKFGGGFSPMPDVFLYETYLGVGTIPGSHVRWAAEVADSTLADDLGDKREDYARAGLPEYWVADVDAQVIHMFADPDPEAGAYRKADLADFGQEARAMTIPGLTVIIPVG